MAKASPIILSFSSGELSPLFGARVDLEEYQSGCSEMENFIPLIQGPAVRRGGTRFVREVKDSTDRTGFLTFEFNVTQTYILEIGDQYMRFYTDHGIVLNGTNPLELATPWTAADLFDAAGNFLLRSVQSGDVLYITHVDGDYQPQKLTRSGALSWTLTDFTPSGGPFEDTDPDETITVYASANTGSISVVASSAIFSAGDVGSLFLIEQKAVDDTEAWEAGKGVSTNDVRRVENRNYLALNTATTGSIVPTHTSGAAFDGDGGVQWQFLDPGFGWGTITAVNSAGTGATLTVNSRIPNEAVASGNATTRWAFGAWSDDLGWPTHVTFFRERLTFARASTRQLWFSVSGDFENFQDRDDGGEVVADSAITIEITSDQVNRIEWMTPTEVLVVGTAGGEFAVHEITTTDPFGPGNVKADQQSGYGSKPVNPVRVGESALFVQRSGRKMRDIFFTIEKGAAGGFRSSNLNVLAPHLLPKGKAITQLAYQQEPHSVVWALRSDGALLGATINANQKRFGWHRHPIGGSFGTGDAVVEAIAVIPNPNADADELWMIVKRTINGATNRYVEYLEPEWDSNQDIIEAFYVDSGLTFDASVTTATITPGAGATVQGTEDVLFTRSAGTFTISDVGREIWYRYQEADGDFVTAKARITGLATSAIAGCTILTAFPSLSAIAAGSWSLTATTISGLDHLEGQTVDVLGDGSSHPQRTVASGAISLQRAVAYAHVGLPCPCRLQTMRVDAGAQDGTSQGKVKRIHKVNLRFIDTTAGYAGPDDAHLDEILFRSTSDPMDEPIASYTGDKEIRWPGTYSKDNYMLFTSTVPLPVTLVAFMPQLVTQDG